MNPLIDYHLLAKAEAFYQEAGYQLVSVPWTTGYEAVQKVTAPLAEPQEAGPIRNSFMLKDFGPDLCVMFPGGQGTLDMVSKCRRAGVPVFTVEDFKNGNQVPVPPER